MYIDKWKVSKKKNLINSSSNLTSLHHKKQNCLSLLNEENLKVHRPKNLHSFIHAYIQSVLTEFLIFSPISCNIQCTS